MRQRVLAILSVVLALWAIVVLEGARSGVDITNLQVGQTPVTRMSDGTNGPPVVIAHGFAGSRQMMQAYGLTLAQAGYTVYAFDFEGHGRHPKPMSGDVTSVDGTTRLLVTQTRTVVEAARQGSTPVALLGHSMATDILVRVAQQTDGIGPLVLLSAYSLEITATHPKSLLLITGAWEPGLTDFALEAAQMADPAAAFGQTVQSGDVSRKALLAPAAEHVAILQSRAGRGAARDWLNRFHERSRVGPVPPTGWALLVLLGAITALSVPLSGLLSAQAATPTRLPARAFWAAALLPAAIAPLLAAPMDTRLLPVLVADYLALHLALFGGLQLIILWRFGVRLARPSPLAIIALVFWALAVFGLALDRYGANFLPNAPRLWIIAALTLGALPFMLADSLLAFGAPLWQRIAARLAFLCSLAAAVALDFEGLFFLIMIAPVIVLFWLTFGTMGRAVAHRAGPTAAGIALGLVLAWALGVSFPLFQA